MQALILKFLIKTIIKALDKRFNLRNIKKYVEEDNELDIKMKTALKNSSKNAKYIEELEKDVAILKKDSHPSQEYICCRKCGCEIAKTKSKKRR